VERVNRNAGNHPALNVSVSEKREKSPGGRKSDQVIHARNPTKERSALGKIKTLLEEMGERSVEGPTGDEETR